MKNLFKSTQTALVSSPTAIPSGLAVKTNSGVYWVKDNKRFKIISDRAVKSWSFTTVNATDEAVSAIKIAGKLGFRDGSLIKNIADSKIYLISQNKRRHIVDPDSFDKYGLNKYSIIEVSESEINMHDIGEKL